jgi:hypothetical protein
MLILILAAELVVAVLLAGVLLIAIRLTMRHGDPRATYELCAVRDKLIGACVFKGVSRDDPWLETLYQNVNSVLLHSHLPGGLQGGALASAAGQCERGSMQSLIPLPDNETCPAAICELHHDLQNALEHLSRIHLRSYLQMSSRERAEKRIQREKAKHLLEMVHQRAMRSSFGCWSTGVGPAAAAR